MRVQPKAQAQECRVGLTTQVLQHEGEREQALDVGESLQPQVDAKTVRASQVAHSSEAQVQMHHGNDALPKGAALEHGRQPMIDASCDC